MLVYGTAIRETIKNRIKLYAQERPMQMAVVKIGDDKAAQSYVKGLVNFGIEVGIPVEVISLDQGCSLEGACQAVETLNQRPEITGIMIQRPLPPQGNKA